MIKRTRRLPPAEMSDVDEETRRLLKALGERHDGRPDNIFTTLANHPDLLKRFLGLGSHILMTSTLPPRDREILILRVGWLCQSEYEWTQHVELARQSGLTGEEIERVTAGAEASGWNSLEAELLRAVDQLHENAFIKDRTWEALGRHYRTRQLMDLVFTVGQYHMVAMALNTFGVQLDPRLSETAAGEACHETTGKGRRR